MSGLCPRRSSTVARELAGRPRERRRGRRRSGAAERGARDSRRARPAPRSAPARTAARDRSTSRGSTVPFQALRSRRNVASTGSSASTPSSPAAAERDRPGADPARADGERAAWRPSPIGRGSRRRAPGTSSRLRGCRSRTARAARAPRRARGRARSRRRPRRPARRGTSSSGGISTAAAWDSNASRNRSTPVAPDGHPGGGTVAAVAVEMLGGRVQRAEQVEAGDAPRPTPSARSPSQRDHDRRAVVALDDPRGHDPDDAGVPSVAGEHVGVALAELGDLRLGLPQRSAARPRVARR